MDWLVIRSKARDELRAQEHLERQGFTTYCPILFYKSGKTEILFPGYLFVKAGVPDLPYGKIRSTRGVLGLVKIGLEPATVSDNLIDKIQRQEQQLVGKSVFKCNDIVEFSTGPFKSLQAVYLCEDGDERSVVLLNLLNSQRKVSIPNEELLGYR